MKKATLPGGSDDKRFLRRSIGRLIKEGEQMPADWKSHKVPVRRRKFKSLGNWVPKGVPYVSIQEKQPLSIVVDVFDTSFGAAINDNPIGKKGPFNDVFNIQFAAVRGIDMSDLEVQRKYCKALEDLMDAWPYGNLASTEIRLIIQRAAVESIAGGFIPITAPGWNKYHGWHAMFWIFDPVERRHRSIQRASSLGWIWKEGKRPIIPGHGDFCIGEDRPNVIPKYVDAEGITVWESQLPTDHTAHPAFKSQYPQPSPADLREREHLFRYFLYLTNGAIMTPEQLEAFLNEQEASLGYWAYTGEGHRQRNKSRLPKVPGHGSLVPAGNWCTGAYRLSRKASHFFGGVDHFASIHTLNGQWLADPFTIAIKMMRHGYDIPDTTIEFARMLDLMHELIDTGHEPPTDHDCSEEMKPYTVHACHRCLEAILCCELTTTFDGLRLCEPCLPFNTEEAILANISADIRMRMSMKLDRDLKHLGIGQEDAFFQQVLDENCEDLEKTGQMTAKQFFDSYLGKVVDIRRGFSPFNVSQFPVFPVFRHASGLLLYHTKGNLILTLLGVNMAKRQWLPGCLQVIADHLRGDLSTESLLGRLRSMHIISLGIPAAHAECVREISDAHWAAQYWSVQSGNPLNDASLNQAQLNPDAMFPWYHPGIKSCGWNNTIKKRIVQIYKETDDKHNTEDSQLDLSGDGSPWLLYHGSRPHNWDWDRLWTLMVAKLHMMTFHCNAKWETVDTEFTLCVEWAHQVNVLAKRIMPLPILLNWRHILHLSIGHYTNGVQMVTGYAPDAQSYADRDDTQCTVIYETDFENRTRFCWRPSDVDKLVSELRLVQVPKTAYNPKLKPPRGALTNIWPKIAKRARYGEYGTTAAQVELAGIADYRTLLAQGASRAERLDFLFQEADEADEVVWSDEHDPRDPVQAIEEEEPAQIPGSQAATIRQPVWHDMSVPLYFDFPAIYDFLASAWQEFAVVDLQHVMTVKDIEAFRPTRAGFKSAALKDMLSLIPNQEGQGSWLSSDMIALANRLLLNPQETSELVYVLTHPEGLEPWVAFPKVDAFGRDVVDMSRVVEKIEMVKTDNRGGAGGYGYPFSQAGDAVEHLATMYNVHGTHWALLVLSHDGTLKVFDSSSTSSMEEEYTALWSLIAGDPATAKFHQRQFAGIENVSCQQQRNISDCGPLAVHNLRLWLSGKTPVHQQNAEKAGQMARIEIITAISEAMAIDVPAGLMSELSSPLNFDKRSGSYYKSVTTSVGHEGPPAPRETDKAPAASSSDYGDSDDADALAALDKTGTAAPVAPSKPVALSSDYGELDDDVLTALDKPLTVAPASSKRSEKKPLPTPAPTSVAVDKAASVGETSSDYGSSLEDLPETYFDAAESPSQVIESRKTSAAMQATPGASTKPGAMEDHTMNLPQYLKEIERDIAALTTIRGNLVESYQPTDILDELIREKLETKRKILAANRT